MGFFRVLLVVPLKGPRRGSFKGPLRGSFKGPLRGSFKGPLGGSVGFRVLGFRV